LTAGSGVSMHGGVPMYTPPQTPGYVSATPVMHASTTVGAGATVVKRENEGGEDGSRDKRRRIAPTLISEQ
jgi:chromatin assembly factor 1 subunit B